MIYPDWLIQDIRIIEQMSYISTLSHSCHESYAEVCFDLAYDEYVQASDERLKNPEPIKLRYPLSSSPSEPDFLSNRDTFPRDLPHLNPVAEGKNASICLWRKGGNSALYLQKGITACLDVLKGWLEDASVKQLQHDGWEPSPRSGLISFNINLGQWQERATEPKYCGKILSTPSCIYVTKKSGLPQLGWVIPGNETSIKKDNSRFLKALKYNGVSHINTYYLVPEDDFVEDKHCSIELDSFDKLLKYSPHMQLAQAISFIQNSKKPKGVSAAILAIAQRRPYSLIEEIPSLSKVPKANKVEITTVLVVHNNNEYTFHGLQVKSPATSEMLANVSGTEILDKDISILGCGSVGGAIADYLARAGHREFSLWDNDIFEAHNNARHVLHQTASERAVLDFKVIKMSDRLKQINTDVKVRHHIRKFDAQEIPKLRLNTHVIDATGEVIEPSWLHDLTVPYTRFFITNMGGLAFLMTQLPGDVADMLDLEAALLLLSSDEPRIREWLHNESQLSDKMLGLSCSSATMEMPWFKINNHTSALMPTLLRQIKSPSTCIVMNTLDPEGNPQGLTTFDVGQSWLGFDQVNVEDAQGVTWTVTFNKSVLETVRNIRQELLPSEAAGYLIGLYNIETKRISIVAATKGEFSSSTSSATLTSIEQDTEAQKILSNSNVMLKPLGTWHSHPSKSAQPSPRDLQTFKELVDIRERILPTVMLICADIDTHFLVGVNRDI